VTETPVSVIVVSRGRPEALKRCIAGVARLSHPRFEVVVVADPAGLRALAPWAGRIRAIAFDEANIARARNLGLAAAAGEIVAFIDDDAVPEPLWLTHLTAPFARPDVAAAGGHVVGRNGISLQWGASAVDRLGRRLPLDADPVTVSVHRAAPGVAIKTEGTNMAFRRTVIAGIGGFDERFAFYLDETDVNLRLAALGLSTAIVPLAVVHHGFVESDRRRADRVPRDLTQIGASLAVFLRKHGTDPATRRDAERAAQRRRLLAHMVAGRIEPRDLRRLLAGFDAGWDEGLTREAIAAPEMGPAAAAFLPFAGVRGARRHVVLSARPWQAKGVRARADAIAATGDDVTLVVLSPSALYHWVSFQPGGWWLQSGGLFGRSLRSDPLVRPWRFRDRVRRESDRVASVRGVWMLP
jgi:GT2 family glycosyltransferase